MDSVQSNSTTLMWVSPMSTPSAYPNPGRAASTVRGRPPSESAEPASATRPSAIRSDTTLLTAAELIPASRASSGRLTACPR